MIWKAGTVMPKKWKTYLPARKKTVSTATHDIPATNATLALVLREAPSVKAINEGATASGFTIVASATNESRATLYNGIGCDYCASRIVGCQLVALRALSVSCPSRLSCSPTTREAQ